MYYRHFVCSVIHSLLHGLSKTNQYRAGNVWFVHCMGLKSSLSFAKAHHLYRPNVPSQCSSHTWAYTLFADAAALVANTPERSTYTLQYTTS